MLGSIISGAEESIRETIPLNGRLLAANVFLKKYDIPDEYFNELSRIGTNNVNLNRLNRIAGQSFNFEEVSLDVPFAFVIKKAIDLIRAAQIVIDPYYEYSLESEQSYQIHFLSQDDQVQMILAGHRLKLELPASIGEYIKYDFRQNGLSLHKSVELHIAADNIQYSYSPVENDFYSPQNVRQLDLFKPTDLVQQKPGILMKELSTLAWMSGLYKTLFNEEPDWSKGYVEKHIFVIQRPGGFFQINRKDLAAFDESAQSFFQIIFRGQASSGEFRISFLPENGEVFMKIYNIFNKATLIALASRS